VATPGELLGDDERHPLHPAAIEIGEEQGHPLRTTLRRLVGRLPLPGAVRGGVRPCRGQLQRWFTRHLPRDSAVSGARRRCPFPRPRLGSARALGERTIGALADPGRLCQQRRDVIGNARHANGSEPVSSWSPLPSI
jgi:hypothetical protein